MKSLTRLILFLSATAFLGTSQLVRANPVSTVERNCIWGGQRDSCYVMGLMYDNGKVVSQDKFWAAEFYEKACDSEVAGACNNLGVMYAKGEGVRLDKSKALQLLGKACDLKSENGCQNHATLKNQDVTDELSSKSEILFTKESSGSSIQEDFEKLYKNYMEAKAEPYKNYMEAKAESYKRSAGERCNRIFQGLPAISTCNTYLSMYVQPITDLDLREKISQMVYGTEQKKEINEPYKNNLLSQCRGYGFQDGTTAFSNCLMQLDQANKQLLQAQQARADLEARCTFSGLAGANSPRTGNFGEYAQNATAYRNNCLAGLPPPTTSVICNKNAWGQITCFAQ